VSRKLSVSAGLAFLAVFSACSAKSASKSPVDSAAAQTFRDDFGNTITVDSTPRRIVSLNPTTTEILFAIGAGPRLVGRTKWDSWPDSVRFVPSVGDAMRPNVEAILNTHPDLVVLYASNDNRPAESSLRKAGIRTIALRTDSIAQFKRITLLLGTLVGEPQRARNVVDSVQATLDRVRAATANVPKRSVFFHTWDTPLITIGARSFLHELVVIAGGTNVYGDVQEISPVVTLEDVVRRNPDVILASPITVKSLLANPQWQAVRAVRGKHVVAYDTNVVGRPAVTLGAAAVNIANLLHPGIVR
jgi:iron complex transport system substrate-binding protein